MAEFIEFLSPAALKDLEKANAELLTMVSNVDKVGQKMKGISTPSGSDSAVKQLTEQYKQQEKVITSLQNKLAAATVQNEKNIEKQRLAEIRLAKSREDSFDKFEAKSRKEQALIEKQSGLYNKAQITVNQLSQMYNNLAIKKELGYDLTVKEQTQLVKLTKDINIYQSALKKVDSQIQKDTRNVGNYAGKWNGLSNSINQLTREAPAFANSMQTGFMAISNNLPILFDEINNITKANKELLAQGQPIKSVFSQIAGSIFSWGTALSIGVTLLTFFGKNIAEFISGMNGATKAVDKNKEALEENIKMSEEYNNKSSDMASNEIALANKLFETARNKNISDAERKKAVDDLQARYPAYLGNLKDEEILTGNITKVQNELIHALKLRAFALAAQDMITENLKKQIKAELESSDVINKTTETNKLYDTQQQSNTKTKKKLRLATEEEINSLQNLEAAQKNSTKTTIKNGKAVNEQLLSTQNKRINALIPLKREEEALDAVFKKYMKYLGVVVDSKDQAGKKKNSELNYEEIRSIYELRKANLDLQIAERAGRMNNEENLLKDRIQARKEYSEKIIELIDLEIKYERDVFTMKYKEDLKENNKAFKDKEISYTQFNKNIIDIQNRYNNEIGKINIDASIKWQQNLKADQDFYKKIELEKRKFNQDTEKIILDSEKNKFKNISDDEKKTLRIRQDAFIEYMILARKELDILKIREIANANSDDQITNITQKYKILNDQLEKQKTPWEKADEGFQKYLRDISSGQIESSLQKIGLSSAKMFLDFDINGQTTFQKIFELADSTGEKIAVIFKSLGDVFQETMGLIDNNQETQYQNNLNRLAAERDIAIKYAGDSATAKTEIERQYEERRLLLEQKRAAQKKRMAIANIAIDTAQAIVAAWVNPGFPLAIPLTVGIAALGAAQIAMVSSQSVPAYAEGTDNHIGGKMMINDQKGSNYVETVVTPDGKTKQYKGRNVVVDAPKGTKVFTAAESLMFDNQLNNMLSFNGITPSLVVNNDNSELKAELKNIASIIRNKESIEIVRDSRGERIYQKSQGQRKEMLNSRLRIKGFDV